MENHRFAGMSKHASLSAMRDINDACGVLEEVFGYYDDELVSAALWLMIRWLPQAKEIGLDPDDNLLPCFATGVVQQRGGQWQVLNIHQPMFELRGGQLACEAVRVSQATAAQLRSTELDGTLESDMQRTMGILLDRYELARHIERTGRLKGFQTKPSERQERLLRGVITRELSRAPEGTVSQASWLIDEVKRRWLSTTQAESMSVAEVIEIGLQGVQDADLERYMAIYAAEQHVELLNEELEEWDQITLEPFQAPTGFSSEVARLWSAAGEAAQRREEANPIDTEAFEALERAREAHHQMDPHQDDQPSAEQQRWMAILGTNQGQEALKAAAALRTTRERDPWSIN